LIAPPSFFPKSSWLIGEDDAYGLVLCIVYPDEDAVVFLGGQEMP
jgi:hypothetical protein